MTIKECLKEIDKADFRIKACQDKIERLETLAHNLSSKPFDTDRVQSSGNKDRIGDITIRIIDEKERLLNMSIRNEELLDDLTYRIGKLENPKHSKALYYLYIDGLRYTEIAEKMDLSVGTVKNLCSVGSKILDSE